MNQRDTVSSLSDEQILEARGHVIMNLVLDALFVYHFPSCHRLQLITKFSCLFW